jgi:hypothetical protein
MPVDARRGNRLDDGCLTRETVRDGGLRVSAPVVRTCGMLWRLVRSARLATPTPDGGVVSGLAVAHRGGCGTRVDGNDRESRDRFVLGDRRRGSAAAARSLRTACVAGHALRLTNSATSDRRVLRRSDAHCFVAEGGTGPLLLVRIKRARTRSQLAGLERS